MLAETGVIFISIDDNEQANLKLIMDEVFGEENFVSTIVWEKRYSPQNAVKWFSESHDFVMVYAKKNQDAKKEINDLFPESSVFDTPKPVSLIKRILQIATNKNALILDSFAGSGTTAQAVLELNKQDGGNRKFILVECEDYADTLTAERVRRVINGYGFSGTDKHELLGILHMTMKVVYTLIFYLTQEFYSSPYEACVIRDIRSVDFPYFA